MSTPSRSPRLPAWLRAGSPVPTWIGLAVSMVGLVLIVVAWGQVAGETEVYRQLPYLVSAAFTGLALIMVGLTIIAIAVQRNDEATRSRQTDRLAAILEELHEVLGREERNEP